MRPFYIFFLITSLSLFAGKSFAQISFIVTGSDTSYVNDTVTAGFTVEQVIGIKNNSDSSYIMDWEIVSATGPHGWGYAVCDLQNCYTFSYHEHSFGFNADSSGTMKLTYAPGCIPGSGQLQVRLWIDGDSVASAKVITWIINVDTANACSTAGIAALNEGALVHVFPNPVQSVLQVSLDNLEDNTNIELYDINGSLIYRINEATLINNIPVQSLSSGNYILKVTTPSGVVTKKIEKI
jgi:Secretion system C-terminal sorting domain